MAQGLPYPVLMNPTKHLDHAATDVAGMRIHYLSAGGGPAVVLLHGDGESAFDWSWVMPELARSHRVYAPDLPGHGDSARPAIAYTPELLTRSVADFLDALGLHRVTLVGNSLGGLIALMLTLDRPERISSLCLVDSGGLGRYISPAITAQALPGFGEMLQYWGKNSLGARQNAWMRAALFFARPWLAPGEWIDEQVRLARLPGFLEAAVSSIRTDLAFGVQRVVLLDRLSDLILPVHVIWGDHDRVLPLSQGREAARRLPLGQLTVIRDAGHLPQVERPDDVLAALVPFLRETAVAP